MYMDLAWNISSDDAILIDCNLVVLMLTQLVRGQLGSAPERCCPVALGCLYSAGERTKDAFYRQQVEA